MQRCDVIIATRNPKTYYLLIKILKMLNLEFVTCVPDAVLAKNAKVVVTTNDETVNNSNATVISVDEEPDSVITSIDIMCAVLGLTDPSEVVIGIDPGMRFGAALVIDGNTIYTRTITSPPAAANLTRKIFKHIDSKFSNAESSIRIGTGSRLYSALFLRSLDELVNDATVELVDEKHTTVPNGYAKDQISAILISARSGRSALPQDLHLRPKRGYVRALRKLVRRLSDDKKRLTVREARSVLLGERSLNEFISTDN